MKRNYNKYQEVYLLAKANLEILEEHEKEIDQQYIISNCIVNPDGSTPKYIYCIEDEAVFEKANLECSTTTETSGLWHEILEARELLKEAEKELLKYALSIAPDKIRATLSSAVASNYTTRLKVLDLAIKLDTSTVVARHG